MTRVAIQLILTGSTAQAINNIVFIGANAKINSPSGSLYRGYLEYNSGFAPKSHNVFSGNTLNFSAKTPAVVQNIGNFEYYNFTLNPIYVNTNTALIRANDISLGANTDNMRMLAIRTVKSQKSKSWIFILAIS